MDDDCRNRLIFGRWIEKLFSEALDLLEAHACTHSGDTTWTFAEQTCGRQDRAAYTVTGQWQRSRSR